MYCGLPFGPFFAYTQLILDQNAVELGKYVPFAEAFHHFKVYGF